MNELLSFYYEIIYTKACLSSVGLSLDIIGAIILFFSGVPSRYIDQRYQRSKVDMIGDDESDIVSRDIVRRHVKNYNSKYVIWSKIGLALLIIGFALQLFSNLYL
ncbi:hypothetical protein KDU71_02635 [Carboxylicivirga sediminis]|uniref:Uncharacterized protein n=1 Tax=Carboxylicivirga sediminis TaxID=2006564 RepID=A0A941F0Z6_9BACT|nr:hypothetical protein [Carboxylicivirga sediminis]MBR8534442.1 hypothetical protein [Carboxylicivirga sediminis]